MPTRTPRPLHASSPQERVGVRSKPVTYQPLPCTPRAEPAQGWSITRAEQLLEQWFDRPVVLLSAGRTGLRLVLQLMGLHRHQDSVRIPRFLSRCVVNAITWHALPIEGAEEVAASLAYHQFGFPLVEPPSGVLVEDIAHGFFANAATGSRSWLSDFAIFSLPKFFPTAGLVGGVVTRSSDQADEIRGLADLATPASPETLAWMRSVYVAAACHEPGTPLGESLWLDAMYELLYQHERPDAASVVGMPDTLARVREVGTARADRLRVFLDYFAGTHPPQLWQGLNDVIPFALPYFGRHGPAGLLRARSALRDEGVSVDIYHVDVRRSADSPDYRECLLLPGHQEIGMDSFEGICATVDRSDRDVD